MKLRWPDPDKVRRTPADPLPKVQGDSSETEEEDRLAPDGQGFEDGEHRDDHGD